MPDDSVDEIFTSHTIDHFTRWQAIDMFKDWHRILRPNGLLTIEVADFWRCVLWLFHFKREKRRLARTQSTAISGTDSTSRRIGMFGAQVN